MKGKYFSVQEMVLYVYMALYSLQRQFIPLLEALKSKIGSDSSRIHSLNKQIFTEHPPCAKQLSGYSTEGGNHTLSL